MAVQLIEPAAARVTIVDNEFIDRYMASANGEYVKVYLYLLRHQSEPVRLEAIADALNHTEADVRRALAYWERLQVIRQSPESKGNRSHPAMDEPAAAVAPAPKAEEDPAGPLADDPAGQMDRLNGDETFAELLYIAQKYMNKVFTQRECQTFAYLYDTLHMKPELLEYLIEYCVQLGHTSIRYIETVALNWHQRGIRTVDAARTSTAAYTKDSFAVMKAFGLTDRKPAETEKRIMEKWFQEWGFSRELVLEACNRTIGATHTPSFPYADKILSDWREAGVHSMADVEVLDGKRRQQAVRKNSRPAEENTRRRQSNQFHNFEQRDVDYDALILQQMKRK